MDSDNAFPKASLHEEIYMHIPEGLEVTYLHSRIVRMDITGTSIAEVNKLQSNLTSKRKCKDVGEM